MAAKREQLRAWIDARPGLAGADLGVRMRSTVFALLGLTTAACLAVVAILVHQGVPFLPSLPLPGLSAGDEHVAAAEPVESPRSTIVAASDRFAGDRLAGASPAAGGVAGGRGGKGGAAEPVKAVAPGPSSVVAPPSGGPVASPTPVSEPPAGAEAPASAPASTPAPVPASAPPASSASSPTDAQLAKGKSSKGSSGKGSSASSRGESGTDAAAPSTKTPSTKKSSPVPASTPEAPPMTDAEPDPVTDADPDDGNGHGQGHWR